jgi:putative two-component system response regulator
MVVRPILSARVLLVGPTEASRELRAVLEGQWWHYAQACTPGEALRLLRQGPSIDLVIITPGESIPTYIEFCRNIKFDLRSGFMSVIFVLGPESATRRTDVLEAGADECIMLPASGREIVLRLSRAVRIKRAGDSLEDATAVIMALANAIEGRDAYTCGHVERVANYSVEIGRQVGMDAEPLSVLETGAVVHDIGKVIIPDHILNKPGKLTEEEMDIVRRHPIVGYDILRPLRTFQHVLPIVRWHHERPNGTGYPDGLKGEELPTLPRIVAVADCFDALITDRPYRRALATAEWRDVLLVKAACGDLDEQLVTALMNILAERAPTLVGAHA